MMKPYFEDAENWRRAKVVLDSWMGTPYRHLWMKKGRGADCSLFIGAWLMELGIIKKVIHDFYPPDWYFHKKVEVIKDVFSKNIATQMNADFDLQLIPVDAVEAGIPLMRGDMLTFCMVPETGVSNHAGILLDPPNKFVHSIQGRGVSLMQFGSFWLSKMTSVYRVVYHGV
jgi:cell wall-associated NlpC family hydrolase